MKRITINGLVLEVEDTLDVQIEGDKITIKGKPAQETHYHYYTYPPSFSGWVPLGNPMYVPTITIGPSTSGGPTSTVTST